MLVGGGRAGRADETTADLPDGRAGQQAMRSASTAKAVPPSRQMAAGAHQYQNGSGVISREKSAQISTTTSSV